MKLNSLESKEIHRILNQTEISPEEFYAWMDKKDNTLYSKLKNIYLFLEKHAPKRIYRLRKYTDEAIDALKNDCVYLSRADWFNDPYDCLLFFDEDKLYEQIKNHISDKNMRHYLNGRNIFFPINDQLRNVDELIAFFNHYKEDVLKSVKKDFDKVITMLQQSTYAACFTETVTSPTMWAHYTDNHKGFAIEYCYESDYFYPSPYFLKSKEFVGHGWRSLLPVYYSKYRIDGTQLADWYCQCELRKRNGYDERIHDFSCYLPDILLKTKLSLHKSESWAYEKEWRLLLTHEWPNDFGSPSIHFETKATGIYIGTQMEADAKKCLIDIASQKKIPIYEMYIDNTSRYYEMQYRLL